ncbi:MAG TPA: FAD-dependent oxidoreductase, partial [Microvirga sp.]|nr:FAD-dependent oxidoreductase [Microvirga sp.]
MIRPISVPALAEPPREADVAVIGAGAAGIGAARHLAGAGLTVAVVEARGRIGGRAVTVPLRGHPVDLGAHWLHAGPINPLVALGARRGEPIRRAPRHEPVDPGDPPAPGAQGRQHPPDRLVLRRPRGRSHSPVGEREGAVELARLLAPGA